MAHVVVVGAGLAGLAAALSAAGAGARVTVIEKEKAAGGNSAKATSGMNAAGTRAQNDAHISDAIALFFADTIESGHGQADPTLARVLVTKSNDAVEWLRSYGVALNAVTLCGGHRAARTHHEAPRPDGKPTPVGWDIVSALRKAVEAQPERITLRPFTRVTELLQDTRGWTPDTPRGACPVTGVRVVSTAPSSGGATEDIECDAVVLATGGFGNDHTPTSLLSQFAPQLACLPTTNGAFAQGDGVKLAHAAGAALVGMEHVQVHPTGLVDPADPGASTKFLGPEALRGVGGLLLNHHGARFVNELGRRDDVTNAMYAHCALPGASTSQSERGEAAAPAPVQAFILMSEAAAAAFGPNFAFYLKVKKFFTEVTGPAGVAAYVGSDAAAERVVAMLEAYGASARGESPDAFGKRNFPDAFDSVNADTRMYIARVTPSIHYTMGGAATNAAAELLYADASEVERRVAMTAALHSASGAVASVVDYSSGSPVRVDATAASPTQDTRFDLPATVASMDLVHAAPDDMSRIAVDSDTRDWGMFELPTLRPIPRLFGAGEVTGGLHGGNRLAGNSLLECAVFGRIAGTRAAAVSLADAPALSPETFTPLRFRESHRVCTSVYLFRFDLPSPLQCTGMREGEYVAVRATLAGAETVRYYSPISRSDARGHIDLLMKVDAAGGAMTTHVNSLTPGETLEFKGPMGGPRLDLRPGHDMGRVKRIGMICGGTGVAAMAQILRSAFYHRRDDVDIRMLYAAGTPDQLAFYPLLQRKALLHPNFKLFCAVEKVPDGMDWSGHVGFINEDMLRARMFAPGDDLLIIMCGPGPMCRALKATLARMNYTTDMVFSYM